MSFENYADFFKNFVIKIVDSQFMSVIFLLCLSVFVVRFVFGLFRRV